MEKTNFYQRLKLGLQKTKGRFVEGLDALRGLGKNIDEGFFEELEEIMISADMGVETVEGIIEELRQIVKSKKLSSPGEIEEALKNCLIERLSFEESAAAYPVVLLIVGVNGTGKTTTAGKLAAYYSSLGKSVLIIAGDTFRAAASSQLQIWAERAGCGFVGSSEGADPSAVLFDGIQSAIQKKVDVLICDTAGRLHTKKNLMQELSKMNRIISSNYPNAEKQVLLVVDAVTGQNALAQAKQFNQAVEIDGIILTKLDGTAKGGIAVALTDQINKSIRFIGVGEKTEDLSAFSPSEFIEALFER